MNVCGTSVFCGKEVEVDKGHAKNPPLSGVFGMLVNTAAFIDKVVMGVGGTLRKRRWKTINRNGQFRDWWSRETVRA